MRLVPLVPLHFAAALLIGAGSAQATTFEYGSYTVVNEQIISISNPTVVSGQTGEIVLTGSGANAGQTVLAWCLDIYHDLTNTGSYNIGTLTTAGSGSPNPTLTSAQIGEIGALMLHGEQNINSPNVSAATQLAIWKLEYGPTFQFTGLTDPTVTLAQQFLTDAGPGGSWAPVPLTTLSQSGNQTLGMVVTPLPGTFSMLLAGLVGLGLWTASGRVRRSPGA
jgi:hypothetical protein